MRSFVRYIMNPELPGRLRPDGWGAKIFHAAACGEIDIAECPALLGDYLAPSLDTTASATASLVWLLSQNPAQWDAIRADPSRIPNAVLEAIRLESPIPAFTRVVTDDVDVGGVTVRRGTRVYLSYASANRDERKWWQPDRFDVSRRSIEQLGFGHGVHSCMGMHLALLEIRSLLQSFASRVRRFDAGQPRRQLNNCLRGFGHLPVTVEPA
jgi:cytochrome P450